MGMHTLGPLAIPSSVLAGVVAFIVFSLLVALGKQRIHPLLDAWSTRVLIFGMLAARAVYVALHWDTFSAEPQRIVMIWQGGFDWVGGFTAAFLVTVLMKLPLKARAAGLGILAVTGLATVATTFALSGNARGVALPDVTLYHPGGESFALSSHAEGPLIINLWATWCPPCRRELPALAAHQNNHPDLPILLVNLEEDPATVQAYLDEQGLALKGLAFDRTSALPKALGTVGVPVTLFFLNGELAELHAGEITPEALQDKTRSIVR